MIIFKNLSLRRGAKVLLDDASVAINSGEKVGLVGRNGAGKSTHGRVLAGLEPSDGGRIARRRDSTVDYLEQNRARAPEAGAGSA